MAGLLGTKAPKEEKIPDILSFYKMHSVGRSMHGDDVYTVTEGTVFPNQIFGVELEIENGIPCVGIDGFKYTNDGSLRNHGVEAISTPTKMKHLEALLKKFFALNAVTEKNYSERCSTHVHMNVQNYTFDELKTLTILYQTVERLLFEFVGHDRKDNIFCTPWYQSGISPNLIDKLSTNQDKVIRYWQKYSALNLMPIRSQGTVEFRHLHGTCDVAVIMQWIGFLACMSKYAKSHGLEELKANILDMNTVSNYESFIHYVFKEHAAALCKPANYTSLLNFGVVDSKLLLLKEAEENKDVFDEDAGRINARALQDMVRAQRGRAYFEPVIADAPADIVGNNLPQAFPDWNVNVLPASMRGGLLNPDTMFAEPAGNTAMNIEGHFGWRVVVNDEHFYREAGWVQKTNDPYFWSPR